MVELYSLDGKTLLEKILTQEIKSVDVVSACFSRIEEVEPKVHAFTELFMEEALARAAEIDKKIAKGEKVGGLAGLPLAVKDIISMKGHRTSAASKMLANYIAPYNSTVIERLVMREDAVVIGNTNMDEFAMGSSTETSYYGPTYNPWDIRRVPGGSSGGSGAAVAADETILSLGTDTGGSIRCPAAYCGVVGLKPTYGRVSRYGIIAYSNSLEQVGPITKTVYDCALLLKYMAGKDPHDSTTVDVPVEDYPAELEKGIDGLVVGIPAEFFGEGIDSEVEKKVHDAIKILENNGVQTVDIKLPHLEYALPTYYLIAMSEASSNLARYDGIRYGYCTDDLSGNIYEVFERTRGEAFGPEVRRRIILGTFALSAGYVDMFYIKALKVRTLIRNDFEEAFKKCNILVGPTMPSTAFEIGSKLDDPLQMYMEDILTVPINLAGIPSISINCGFSSEGLPIGLQLMGNLFRESEILRAAYFIERKLDLNKKKPNIGGD